MLNLIMLIVVMLNVLMLDVVMLDAVMLNVVAPAFGQCNVSFSFSSFSLDATLANICFLSSFKIKGEFTFAILLAPKTLATDAKNALDLMPRAR